MNRLPRWLQILLAVMALSLTLLIPSVGFVYGSISDLRIEDARQQEQIKNMVKQVDDMWRMFHPRLASQEPKSGQ